MVGSTGQGRSAGGYLASKAVVLKGQGEGVCRAHLPLDPLPFVRTSSAKDHRAALIQSLFKLLWKGGSPLVRRQVCYQRPCDGGLGMPDLESHR